MAYGRGLKHHIYNDPKIPGMLAATYTSTMPQSDMGHIQIRPIY